MYPPPFKRPKSPYYYFRYTDPYTNKRILKSTRQEIKKRAIEEIQKHMDSFHGISQNAAGSLADFLQPWVNGKTNPRYERYQLEGKEYGKKQVADVARFLTQVLTYPIVAQLTSKITRGMVLDLRATLQTDPKYKTNPRTINRTISALSAVYSESLYRGELRYNPFSGIGNIKYQQKVKEILSPEELKDFLNKKYFPSVTAFNVFSLAAYTGLRMSELLALHWDQYKDGVLSIDKAWKTEHELGSPKWGKTRMYPLSELAIACLPEKTDSLIFHRNGIRLGSTWWIKNFRAAIANAKIEKTISPHCLRHSLNSNLLLAGVSPFLIQHYLGWSSDTSITKVQEGYTHVNADHLQPVADMIDLLYTKIEKNNIIQFRKIE
ncbi:MAG: site-specific integrase [Bacteroidetes bacterium]|nr:site-specific integrase [Bacteroidota bacterium]